jgi:cytochrome c-type biogenesis protein CcmH/NrfG
VFEELAPLPENVGRKGLYVAATLLRTDGGKPRAFRSLADDNQAVVESVSDDTLRALAGALAASVAEAITLIQSGEAKDSTTQANQLLQEAADQMAVGKYRLAVDAYNRALRFQPRDAETYFRLGNAYAALGNHKGAVVAYRQSLFLRGESTETMLALARAHQQLGELEPLLEVCRKLSKRAPDVAEHQKILAEALVSKRKALSAISSRQEADKVFEEARLAYRRAIELSDRKPELWREYAELLFANNDYGAAVGAIREALKTTPEDAELRRLLWTSLLCNGEYEPAIVELLDDTEGDPNLGVKPDETLYRKLTIGLDRRARQTFLKASEKRQDFAADKLTREEFLQWTKEFLAETDRMTDLADRVAAPGRYGRVHLARQFAFALMGQWALNEQRYVETLDALYADQAVVKQKCAAQSFDEVHRLEREQS